MIMDQCEGFNEDLVLAVKHNFEEQEIRSILIQKQFNNVKYFSRNCTGRLVSQSGIKRVCEVCDKWFTQLSASETHNATIFTIDNFLNSEHNQPEKSDFTNNIPDIFIEDVDENVEEAENSEMIHEENNKERKPRNFKYKVCDKWFTQVSASETHNATIFTIDNFLNSEHNQPEKSDFSNNIPDILIEDVDENVEEAENSEVIHDENIKERKPRNYKYKVCDVKKIKTSIEETNGHSVKNKAVCDICGESVTR